MAYNCPAVPPVVTISPTSMNVLYTMVDNPVSVSAPGIANENLIVSITPGCQMAGSRGNYIVKAPTPGQPVKISVSARIGGAVKEIGFMNFRVRKLQTPTAMVNSLTGGPIPAQILKVQWGIFTQGSPEFNVTYPCVGANINAVKKGNPVTIGNTKDGKFTTQIKDELSKLNPGDRVFIEDVYVMMPNKTRQKVNDIYFNLK